MKSDIAQIRRKTWKNNFEGLDRSIQVHVKHSIVIVPQPGIWPSYLVSYKENTVIAGIGLKLTDCGAGSCPRLESGLHSDSGTDGWKVEKCRAAAN